MIIKNKYKKLGNLIYILIYFKIYFVKKILKLISYFKFHKMKFQMLIFYLIVPGVIQYKGAKIQILDLPGIIEGAKDGKGRGRQVIAVARTCSLIFIVLDVLKPLTDKRIIERELEGFGIRLNKQPPNISFKKKDKGGVTMSSTVNLTHLDLDQVKAVLAEYKIHNADINFKCKLNLYFKNKKL